MKPNQDGIDPSYLQNYYLRTKLKITSMFMAAMLSNPQIYTWFLEQDQSQEQEILEDIMVTAHNLAVKTMLYCQPPINWLDEWH